MSTSTDLKKVCEEMQDAIYDNKEKMPDGCYLALSNLNKRARSIAEGSGSGERAYVVMDVLVMQPKKLHYGMTSETDTNGHQIHNWNCLGCNKKF
jgi:hypothetical protein